MRFDSIGMFWQDEAVTGKRNTVRQQPAIPDTGWQRPAYFPNLSNADVISLDCETYDPHLIEKGPGWARNDGHIVGVSIGAPGGYKWYFPVRHTIEASDNFDPETVFEWLRETLGNPRQPKVGANIVYDIGWLRHEGIIVRGELWDVQYAEALLDERAHVSLETLAQKYLGEGKDSSLLYQWCADYYGGVVNDRQRKNIYRTPPRLSGPYAESDADLPLRVLAAQWPHLQKEGLLHLLRMECDLIYLLIDMRYAGVHVDVKKAELLRERLLAEEAVARASLKRITGVDVDINASESLARAFDAAGLAYGRTKKSNEPSFTKDFLKSVDHPIAGCIREIRKLEKLRGTFVESYILDSHVNGMVYGQFHPMRSDQGGTRSGRYSSSNPNLQNLPSRDEELAPLVRGLFIPDDGHKAWRKYDYSQIEYRFLVHYAVGPGIEAVRDQFNHDPNTDYHVFTQHLVAKETGIELGRKPIKNINFGLLYGMGIPHLCGMLGVSLAEGKKLFEAYHKGVPFISKTMETVQRDAEESGIVTTIFGRRSRFDLWEPEEWQDKRPALPFDVAIRTYGRIKRAYTHKALNRKLQGSAAELMKAALHKCYTSGIFNETGIPRLTVHDEADFSDPGDKEEAYRAMQDVMENVLKLRIPIKAEGEMGPDWGHTEKFGKSKG